MSLKAEACLRRPEASVLTVSETATLTGRRILLSATSNETGTELIHFAVANAWDIVTHSQVGGSVEIYLWLISLTASKELSILLLKLLKCMEQSVYRLIHLGLRVRCRD